MSAKSSGLASYEERLRAAKSVKVMTSVFGVSIGTKLEEAHVKLDKLSKEGKATKEEGEDDEGESGTHKTLWEFVGTEYSALYAKTNEEGDVTSITAFRREGNELPFDKIGELKKAPLQNDRGVAWDVVQPNRPLFRVVAEGAEGKARTITLFLVRHAGANNHNLTREAPKSAK